MSGHTPGPWAATYDPTRDSWRIDSVACPIATVWGLSANVAANARLIAAAPELLATLTSLLLAIEAPVTFTRHGPKWLEPLISGCKVALALAVKP